MGRRSHAYSGAEFSVCQRYRYTLVRRWNGGPRIAWVLLNPSKADELSNDPTIERCCRRSLAMSYGELRVVNLFALRSTKPRQLYEADDPVGPDNDDAILRTAGTADFVICGWGNHGRLHDRGQHVLAMLREAGVMPHCLRMTGAGEPGHPLYVPYSAQPILMEQTGV